MFKLSSARRCLDISRLSLSIFKVVPGVWGAARLENFLDLRDDFAIVFGAQVHVLDEPFLGTLEQLPFLLT